MNGLRSAIRKVNDKNVGKTPENKRASQIIAPVVKTPPARSRSASVPEVAAAKPIDTHEPVERKVVESQCAENQGVESEMVEKREEGTSPIVHKSIKAVRRVSNATERLVRSMSVDSLERIGERKVWIRASAPIVMRSLI